MLVIYQVAKFNGAFCRGEHFEYVAGAVVSIYSVRIACHKYIAGYALYKTCNITFLSFTGDRVVLHPFALVVVAVQHSELVNPDRAVRCEEYIVYRVSFEALRIEYFYRIIILVANIRSFIGRNPYISVEVLRYSAYYAVAVDGNGAHVVAVVAV